VIPSLSDFRQNHLTREQARTFSTLIRVIALGRLPGEQSLSRRAALTRLLIALVMSAALWLYVTDQENPVIVSQPYSLQVKFVNVPKGLTPAGQTPPVVTVYAHGLKDAVNGPQQISPVADLSAVSPNSREATVPITIQGGRSGVSYTSVPASVTVRLEPYVSKTVQVVFNDQAILSILPATLQLLGEDISPKVLTVTGPADLVNRVNSASVAPVTTSIAPPSPTTTMFQYPITSFPVLLDRQSRQIAQATSLLPASTRVTVTLQIGVTLQIKTLAVAPIVPFSPPEGYQLDGLQVSPSTVTVLGPPDVVGTLKAISTKEILLLNVTKSMTITTSLDLQALGSGVSLYDAAKHAVISSGQGAAASSVQVHVSISEQQVTDTLPAKVVVDNVKPGLRALTDIQWLGVYVKGAYVDIKNLGSLTAHVNAAGLVQGTYNLKPKVKLPPSLPNFSLTRATIHVVLLPYHK
jgi:YbbR domain-containing protein